MTKKNKIYVTTMYRYGSKENHSYIVYIGDDENEAIKIGKDVYEGRGHKYSFVVVSSNVNDPMSIKTCYFYEMY